MVVFRFLAALRSSRLCLILLVLCCSLSLVACAAKSRPGGKEARKASLFSWFDEEHEEAPELEPELTMQAPEGGQARKLTPEEERALREEAGKHKFDTRETAEFLYYYQFFTAYDENGSPGRGRQAFERWLRRAELHLPHIRKVLRAKGIHEDVVYLPFVESGFNNWAYSRSGAGGMWQFMPFTGQKYGLRIDWWLDERRDPYRATVAAADYLAKLHEQFGDWHLALAAYNAGEGKIARVMEESGCTNYYDICASPTSLKSETKHYVPKFLAIVRIVRNLPQHGFAPLRESALELVDLRVKPGTDLQGLATAMGQDWEEFNSLNPAFRRKISPPDSDYVVHVPTSQRAAAEQFIATAPTRQAASHVPYLVRKGDTWYGIARRFETTPDLLHAANPEIGDLSVGKTIQVPAGGLSPAELAAMSGKNGADKSRSQPPAQITYVARKGDTIASVAKAHKIDIKTILTLNGISSKSSLRPGQKLTLPAPVADKGKAAQERVHVARKGDTLYSIARAYKVDVKDLVAANGLRSQTSLATGQKIRVPLPASAPSAPAQGKPSKSTAATAGQPEAKSKSEPVPAKGKGDAALAAKGKVESPAPAKNAAGAKGKTHTVRQGDTVWSIARQYNLDPKDMLAWNKFDREVKLRPGDTVKVAP